MLVLFAAAMVVLGLALGFASIPWFWLLLLVACAAVVLDRGRLL